MTKAEAPARSTNTITIGFGLISVECALYAGVEADAGKIVRHERVGDGDPVGRQPFNKNTGEVIESGDVYKVYTTEDDTEISLSNEEIVAAMGVTDSYAEIEGFYPLAQRAKYNTTGLMQVRPKKTKGKSPFDKPFTLLMLAMEQTGTFALIRWTASGTSYAGVLTGDGYLRPILWEEQVREARPMPDVEIDGPELNMAMSLISTMQETKSPVVTNERVAKVRDYAETKAAAQNAGAEAPEVHSVASNKADISNLLATLSASIDAAKSKKVGV